MNDNTKVDLTISEIDWDVVNQIMDREKRKSKQWIDNVIKELTANL